MTPNQLSIYARIEQIKMQAEAWKVRNEMDLMQALSPSWHEDDFNELARQLAELSVEAINS